MSIKAATLALVAIVYSSITHADLVSRLNGLAVYDTDQDITWLADGSFSVNQTYGLTGINEFGYMNWDTANLWIDAMNTANHLGVNSWRLPTTVFPDTTCSGTNNAGFTDGFFCSQSEMGHLFYIEFSAPIGLGGILASNDPDLLLFQDLQSHPHWVAEEYVENLDAAWRFNFANGTQIVSLKNNLFTVLPVMTGDIANLTTVPLPASVWLFSAGLNWVNRNS